MPLTHYALDRFVSQEISKLTACTARAFGSELPDHAFWINTFVLRRILNNHIPEERAALAFVILRRAEAAVDEWEIGCKVALGDLTRPSAYFRALRHFEACIGALWQGLDFGRKALLLPLFEKGDNSVYERVNGIYNTSRHFDPSKLPSGDLHAIWLTNEAVRTQEHRLEYDELRGAVASLARIADGIVNGPPTSPTDHAADAEVTSG